jgi:hypothetical protein
MSGEQTTKTGNDEAPVGAPGAIAARQAEARPGAPEPSSEPQPFSAGPSTNHVGPVAVGTPGASDSTNPTPESGVGGGLSGGATNDLATGGGTAGEPDR